MKGKVLVLMAACALLCGCSDNVEQPGNENEEMVTFTFAPYQVEEMTRASSPISEYVSHLDVWVSDGGNVLEAHQSSSDTGFGSVKLSLNKTKTYTLYAIAHKCTSDATLNDGIISFPDDKITQSFFYTTSFSPATNTNLNCTMNRIVGMFRVETTDNVPDNVSRIDYTIASAYTRWNVAGAGTNAVDRTGTINIPAANIGSTVSLMLYLIPSTLAATDNYTITMSAKTSSDEVIEAKTFQNVPVKANYKSIYRGAFFTTGAMSVQFVADDWQEFDAVEF